MKRNVDVDPLHLLSGLKTVPKGLLVLAALGGAIAMVGYNALVIRPRFKRMLLDDFAGNDQAIQFINWVVIPENAIGLIVFGAACALPLILKGAETVRQLQQRWPFGE